MNRDNLAKLNRPELLAPAGSPETFYAVLRAGADAVYLAGPKFGARAFADNFTVEELCDCIRYAHLYNRKVYLTVNTLIKNNEFADLYEMLVPVYQVGLDGVIIQDLGAFSFIKEHFPGLELHASTQMNITTVDSAEYIKRMGACRIVPARELSLNELKDIKAKTGLELEVFIHGAMCYCYSGQCLFSSVVGSRSGNRGKCAQPCRMPYEYKGNTEYLLSLKDMCTIDLLPELIDAGISSFKIEGRMKKAEYAAGITAIYRKYIDLYIKNGEYTVSKSDRNILNSLYIRNEIQDGYYKRYNGKEMITVSSPAYNGTDENVLKRIHDEYVGDKATKELPSFELNINAGFITGEQAYINANCGDYFYSSTGEVVQTASKRPITTDDVVKQLSKLGNTSFVLSKNFSVDNDVYVSNDAYYNLKGINEIRREMVSELEKQIIEGNGFSYYREGNKLFSRCVIASRDNKHNCTSRSYALLINTIEQYLSFDKYLSKHKDIENEIGRIYLPEELVLNHISEIKSHPLNIPVFLAFTYVRRSRDKIILDKVKSIIENNEISISGILVKNIEDIDVAKSLKLNICSDYGLYCWNDYALNLFINEFDSIGLPLELAGAVHKAFSDSNKSISFEKLIYGRIPLMHTANCIRKTKNACRLTDKSMNDGMDFVYIKDRTNRFIPVNTDCVHCHNTLYNAVPLTIYKNLEFYSNNVTFRIDFSDETSEDLEKVLDFYFCEGNKDWESTTGFEKNSTE